jgi:hypothetical protein
MSHMPRSTDNLKGRHLKHKKKKKKRKRKRKKKKVLMERALCWLI